MPFNQKLRKESTILWTISLIQDKDSNAQTGDELIGMVSDIIDDESSIAKVTICLADRLQRFRFMIEEGISEKEAIEKCDIMAKQWHQNNEDSLKRLESKGLAFITWQEFLDWPGHKRTLDDIKTFYTQNKEFRNNVDGRVRQEFKNINHLSKLDVSMTTDLLKQYVFEECAFQKFAANQRFAYELYKTPMSKSMRQIKNNMDFVPPGYLCEVSFTQFNPKHQKQKGTAVISESRNKPILPPLSKPVPIFSGVFSAPLPSLSLKTDLPYPSVGEFVESSLRLLPPEKRPEATQQLVEFIFTRIIPLSYSNVNFTT